MKALILVVLVVLMQFSVAFAGVATKCNLDDCKIESDCRCSDAPSPLNPITDYPQLVSLTFDEAVTLHLYENTWKPLLFNLVNPDSQPIGGTFFVPHEFTDYVKVNELYNSGFEVGVRSVTENQQSYWRTANETILEQEFKGQKTILNKFANIPENDIKGARTPQLQLNGDSTFQAYAKAGLEYDSSWPTLPMYPMFPYTLEYASTQMCLLGARCPTDSFKNFWVFPIIDLHGYKKECNAIATCNINGTAEVISDWLLGEVKNTMGTTRAPLTLMINSYWFEYTENSYEALQLFFKKVAQIKEIFLVSQSDVIDFMKKPIKLADYKTPTTGRNARCQAQECVYSDVNRNMRSCTPCPDVYPSLGNPEGKKK